MSSLEIESELVWFHWSGPARAVGVVGSVTNWPALHMTSSGGDFVVAFKLPPGIYSYKFQVDGKLRNDPKSTMALDESGFNQVQVCPELPSYLPRSILGNPPTLLFLKFHPSVMSLVEDCIRRNGYNKNLVSVIVMDPELASACAVLVPESIKKVQEVCNDLNGVRIRDNYQLRELQVLPFKPTRSSSNPASELPTPKSESGFFRLAVGPQFPKNIIGRHIAEYFVIFKPRVEKLADCSFMVTLPSRTSAEEAVKVFNNSLLKGIQITVNFVGDLSQPNAADMARQDGAKALTSIPAASQESYHREEPRLSETESLTSNRVLQDSQSVCKTCNIFVYSRPKFPEFVRGKDLMDHFQEYNPVNAFIIKREKRSTGTAKVTFPSRDMAEKAMMAKNGTKVLKCYGISLKFENPAHPPKPEGHHTRHGKWEGTTASSQEGCPGTPPVTDLSPPLSQSYQNLSVARAVSLKVSHLPHTVTIQKLIGLFKKFGELDGNPVIHKGRDPYAHVNFRAEAAAENALQLNGFKFEGSRITVKLVRSPPGVPKEACFPEFKKRASCAKEKESYSEFKERENSAKFKETTSSAEFKERASSAKFKEGATSADLKEGASSAELKEGTSSAELKEKASSAELKEVASSAELKEGASSAEFKERTSSAKFNERASSAKQRESSTDFAKDMKLMPGQWNRLMMVGPGNTTLLEDMIIPYKDNPNITIHPVLEEKVLRFTGRDETVQSAFKYFTVQLKKDLEIDRVKMEAMVFLLPSLSSEMESKYSVTITGYHRDSGKISLDGPMSGIEQAYEHIQTQVSLLLNHVLHLGYDYPMEQLEIAQRELGSGGIYLLPEPSSKMAVSLYHFSQLDVVRVEQRLKSLLISTKAIACKPELLIFLQHHFSEAEISKKLTSISFDKEAVLLKGTPPSIGNVEKEIERILSEIYWYRVSLSASEEVASHIRDSILEPFQRRDITFTYFITQSSEMQRDVHIYSKNTEIHAEACKRLSQLDPVTKEYPLPETADEIVAKIQDELESSYLVRIVCHKSSVTIYGLVAGNIDQCYNELMVKIDSTLSVTKLLPITVLQNQLFRQLYKDELSYLRKQCSSLSFENNNLKLTGTIKQVNDVTAQLNSGILSMKACSESFEVGCKSQECGMWQNWWQQLKEKERKNSKVLITISSSGPTEFHFEVLGTDNKVKEIMDTIIDKEVQKSLFVLPKMALKRLSQAKQENQLKFLERLAVSVSDINQWKKEVTICAPRECAGDLNTAIEEIRSFVGEHEEQTERLFTFDPVVRSILQSQQFDPYLTKAQAEVNEYDVTVSVMKGKESGLQITGVRSSLEIARPIIHKLTIETIQKSIDQKQVSLEHIFTPLLTSPEFVSQLKSKLVCVTCFISQDVNQTISTTWIDLDDDSSIQVDIVKGNILSEHADSIVNAANGDLQHFGGLAKAISDAGGPDIQSECGNYVAKNSRIKAGEAVCLGPGGLPYRYVIHAVGPQWKDGKSGEEDVLYLAVLNSLKLADEASLRSIAVPAVSTGIFNVPVDVCARASFKAVEEFANTHPKTSLRKLKFVLRDQSVVDIFSHFTKEDHQSKNEGVDSTSPKVEPISATQVSSAAVPAVSLPSEEVITQLSPPSSVHSVSGTKLSFMTPTYQWKWEDDSRRNVQYTKYTNVVNRQLNSAYHVNPIGSCLIHVNSVSYKVDFASMRQINTSTGFKRRVEKVIVPRDEPKKSVRSWASRLKGDSDKTISTRHSNVTWQYRDDRRVFTSYSPKDSEYIEGLYQGSDPFGYIMVNGMKYTFDFDDMMQINDRTKYKRMIRRVTSTPAFDSPSKPTEGNSAPNSFTLTLRGPQESLPIAERNLVTELHRHIIQNTIPLKTVMTEELREQLIQIALENNVGSSFGEVLKGDSMQEVMKLDGVKSKVLEANKAIHEQLLAHMDLIHETEKSKLLRQATMISASCQLPPEWEPHPEGKKKVEVFDVSRDSDEWAHVEELFSRTMLNHTIERVTRIQNILLWEKYSLSKKQLENKYEGDANEIELFHGSGTNDPEEIYGGEDAFDMRHSDDGMWGKANYFAENADYSDRYSHSDPDRNLAVSSFSHNFPLLSSTKTKPRKSMLLAKVLVGESFKSPPDKSIRMPPTKPGRKMERYDSVSGTTRNCNVYMTYDNARAYPAYLITYYRD